MRIIFLRGLVFLGLLNPNKLSLETLGKMYSLPDYVGKIVNNSREIQSTKEDSFNRGFSGAVREFNKAKFCKKCRSFNADLFNK
jgi:hypothetical protein